MAARPAFLPATGNRRGVQIGLITNNDTTGRQVAVVTIGRAHRALVELHVIEASYCMGHARGFRRGMLLGVLAGCVLIAYAFKLGTML